ncbi:spore coat protein F [Clostridium sp. CAG:921]|nr:spore coat protein F [Clostridium sp. CAG:921]
MTEKVAINDVLSCTNSMITLLTYTIEQANNKNFRDEIVSARNKLENLQWQTYLLAKEKGYYVPAAPAGEADITQVKNAISK